jgi:hypothetical protein
MPPIEPQKRLRPHHVGDRYDRKVQAVRTARLRIERGWTGRAHAAAENIRTNNEKPIRVERLARARHGLPPAWSAGDRVRIGDMLVAGQSVAKKNGVRFGGVESAIGLVGDGQRRQRRARIHAQGGIGAQAQGQAVRRNGLRDRAVQKRPDVSQRSRLLTIDNKQPVLFAEQIVCYTGRAEDASLRAEFRPEPVLKRAP